MLWQQKFFDLDPFKGLKIHPQMGQTCSIDENGMERCKIEAGPTASSTPVVPEEPKSFPIVPVAIGGAALVAALLFLTK